MSAVARVERAAAATAERTERATAAEMLAADDARALELERVLALQEAAERAATRSTPATFVDCRLFGHSWHEIEADRNPAIGWYMKLQCERCHTVRADIVNRFGGVERRRYEYPDSYKDTDHWARTDWRMQYLRRLA